ncbi:hypothetical protein E2C01_031406 [Portunus trituberculatus]|uniref:Uncharacterized protein n=1 Tax=Portunus trituberculatus TaxID=210409 RepID=A0A5B7ETC1_PORTR|nr:hypothetical protein [Portunus trituberculatus]
MVGGAHEGNTHCTGYISTCHCYNTLALADSLLGAAAAATAAATTAATAVAAAAAAFAAAVAAATATSAAAAAAALSSTTGTPIEGASLVSISEPPFPRPTAVVAVVGVVGVREGVRAAAQHTHTHTHTHAGQRADATEAPARVAPPRRAESGCPLPPPALLTTTPDHAHTHTHATTSPYCTPPALYRLIVYTSLCIYNQDHRTLPLCETETAHAAALSPTGHYTPTNVMFPRCSPRPATACTASLNADMPTAALPYGDNFATYLSLMSRTKTVAANETNYCAKDNVHCCRRHESFS